MGAPTRYSPRCATRRPASTAPSPRCYLDHAAALAVGDATALDEVSRRLETLGALPYAAEAAGAVALAHARSGSTRAARASGARAAALRDHCEGAVSPCLAGATTAIALTARERQIAALAAAGHTDADIARQLRLSVRTVHTHLAHTYDKLGVTRRTQLHEHL